MNDIALGTAPSFREPLFHPSHLFAMALPPKNYQVMHSLLSAARIEALASLLEALASLPLPHPLHR